MSSAPLYIALLILQRFRHFTYVTAHSPTLPPLYLRHSSFSNPSLASPTSQLILQPFRRFTYVTANSSTLLSLLLRHRLFTFVTWRATHGSLYSTSPSSFYKDKMNTEPYFISFVFLRKCISKTKKLKIYL